MKKIMVLAIAGVGLMFSSCSQLDDKAGKAFCACMENAVKIEAEEKENPGTYTEQEMNKAFSDMESCLEKVKNQYKDLVSEDGVKKSIKENCPETYKAMYPEE